MLNLKKKDACISFRETRNEKYWRGILFLSIVFLVAPGNNVSGLEDGNLSKEEKELLDYTMLQSDTVVESVSGSGKKLEIINGPEPELPLGSYKGPQTASSRNIEIRGNNIYQNGKPAFLFGEYGTDRLALGLMSPALLRIVGFDFVQGRSPYLEKVSEKDNTITISYSKTGSYNKLLFEEYLPFGFSCYGAACASRSYYKVVEKYFPEAFLAKGNHTWWPFSYENPLGRRLWFETFRYSLLDYGKYPCFVYKIGNEVYFNSATTEDLAKFRAHMRKKYRTIDNANKTWGSNYKSFNDISMPNIVINKNNYPKDLPWPVFCEYKKWHERYFGEVLEEMCTELHRRWQGIKCTVQSQCGYFMFPCGVVPSSNRCGVDVYGDEMGYNIGFGTTADVVKNNLPFHVDIVGSLVPEKPILNEEGPFHISTPELSEALESPVIDLHGKWSFSPDRENRGEVLGWYKPEFNDSIWTSLHVPGQWGEQGFPDDTLAWYRKTVKIPPSGKELYFIGDKIAQAATVWVNGNLIHTPHTSGWDSWNIPVSQYISADRKLTIAMKIQENAKENGICSGGINGGLALTKLKMGKWVDEAKDFSRDSFKTLAWAHYSRGYSGWINWAWYGSNKPLLQEAISGMADFKLDVENLAPVIGERPRIKKANTGILFPFCDLRVQLSKNYADMLSGKWVRPVKDAYYALNSTQNPICFFDDDALANPPGNDTKLIAAVNVSRVADKTLATLDAWIKNGGILLTDYRSFKVNDDTHQLLQPEFLGVKIMSECISRQETLRFEGWTLPEIRLDGSVKDRFSEWGRKLPVDSTESRIIARFENGMPAIVETPYGKGKTYVIGADIPVSSLALIYQNICAENNIKGPVSATLPSGKNASNFDVKKLGAGSKFVWLVSSYQSKDERLHLALNESLPFSGYRIREVSSRKDIPGPENDGIWSETSLKKGFDVDIPALCSKVFLLESTQEGQLELKNHPPARKRFLERYEKLSSNNDVICPNGKRILFSSDSFLEISHLPTVVWLARNFGYQVNQQWQEAFPSTTDLMSIQGKHFVHEKFSDYDVIVLPSGGETNISARRIDDMTRLVNYVADGGSLLICGTPKLLGGSGNKRIENMLASFGIKASDNRIETSYPYFLKDYYVKYPVASTHPIAKGCSYFYGSGESFLSYSGDYHTILQVPENAKTRNSEGITGKAVMIAGLYGKGRIVFINGARWLRPDDLWRGDNARLLLNAFDWLAGIERSYIDETKIKDAVDCRDVLNEIDPQITF